ncbi:hypothetical protein MUK42_32929 [Musa troglodytarum]|uniref:Uncharacterized protein n=1 Tax=Musa troglodytarum TaxID=320322 RepID=A0A9E7F8G0_9LILI|nr:hypothetical protein MUK42_32929 [Musa troglodytarum]
MSPLLFYLPSLLLPHLLFLISLVFVLTPLLLQRTSQYHSINHRCQAILLVGDS